MAQYLATVFAILRKDLAVEWRSRQLLAAMLIFTLLVILIFNFALELDARVRSEVSAGVLWATFAFAGTLGLNRSMAVEKEGKALDGLLLAPVDRSAVYFGKAFANLFFMLVVAVLILPMYAILYNVNLWHSGFLLVVLLGSWGYSAIGTLLATMAIQARSRELLLPVLLFPLLIPVFVTAVRASSFFLQGLELTYIWPSLNLLIAYGLIMPALGYMFFDFIVEE
ncbi:MAG: heme exporter protein CcmB [Chloroflexi bacterium]|nr:heme exporter protein CcmB [Chloroflexota bacterium]